MSLPVKLVVALAILFVVVGVIFYPQQTRDVQIDIIQCANNHTHLKGYTVPYDGTANAPDAISYYNSVLMDKTGFNDSEVTGETMCTLQDNYKLNFSRSEGKAWIETNDADKWVKYGGGGPSEPAAVLVEDKVSGSETTSYCTGDLDSSNLQSLSSAYHYLKFDVTGVDNVNSATLSLFRSGKFNGDLSSYTIMKVSIDDYGSETQNEVSYSQTFGITGNEGEYLDILLESGMVSLIENGELYLRIGTPGSGSVYGYFCKMGTENPPYLTLA